MADSTLYVMDYEIKDMGDRNVKILNATLYMLQKKNCCWATLPTTKNQLFLLNTFTTFQQCLLKYIQVTNNIRVAYSWYEWLMKYRQVVLQNYQRMIDDFYTYLALL